MKSCTVLPVLSCPARISPYFALHDSLRDTGPTSATKESGTASEACKKEPASTDELVKIVPSIQTWRDFDQLLMESERELLNIARFFIRYDSGGADAEDIVQQARLKAYAIHSTRLGKVEDTKSGYIRGSSTLIPVTILSPEAWLHTIVRNTGRNYYDYRKRLLKLLESAGRDIEDKQQYEDPLRKVIKDENDKELHNLVDMLPPHFATVIKLSFFADRECSLQEIANELGCGMNTVKSYKRRALDMLREALGNQRDIRDGRIGRKKRIPRMPAA